MDTFTKHYFLDWVAMILSIIGAYMLAKKKRPGFVISFIANLMWAGLGFTMLNSEGIAVGNLVFAGVNLRGFFKWNGNEDKEQGEEG